MYENYTRALQVLDVLERACEKLQRNQRIKLKSVLSRKGLLAEPSVAYLMDSLRPKKLNGSVLRCRQLRVTCRG
jgi:hypothetical protein